VALLLLLGAAVFAGCSIEKHYELLSVFFDGVPDPNAPDSRGLFATDRPGTPVMVSRHSAWEERRCADCHGKTARFSFSAVGFSELDERVCLKCHEDLLDGYSRVHGPVAARACLFCHQPHQSPYPDLLKLGSPQLCMVCHSFTDPLEERHEAHRDLDRDCLECHHGHGGSDPYFLRPPEPALPEPEDGPMPLEPSQGSEE
jgi:predicted CXXCH cytochrome family protein